MSFSLLRFLLSFLYSVLKVLFSAFAESDSATASRCLHLSATRIASSAAGGGPTFLRFRFEPSAIRRFRSEYALVASFSGSGGLKWTRTTDLTLIRRAL